MTFGKIKKAAIIMMLGILSVIATDSYASVTWLSSITNVQAPTGIAADAKGNIYVTENSNNRLFAFDRHGTSGRTLSGLQEPVGVAVDGAFRVFVANRGTGSVNVYNPDFTLAYKLGKGDGEFKAPTGVAISANGRVYVADRGANAIKIYNLDGTPVSSFGTYGGGNGQFNAPLGLTIDDARGELYVTDSGIIPDSTNSNAPMGGARVQVFDLNGNFSRSFGTFGSSQGQMKMPTGIATDGAGTLYITDPGWAPSAFHVFSVSGAWINTIADSAHPLKGVLGNAIGQDHRMFVASLNGPSVEVYGLDGYTTMDVTSATPLSFSTQAGTNPAAQSITISNSGSGTLNWTATAATSDGAAWLVPQASGSTTAGGTSTISVSVDVVSTSLPAGNYTGTVTISAPGAEEKVSVSLTVTPAPVPQAVLSVTPQALSFKAQMNGPAPAAQALSVQNTGGGSMTWSATAAPSWISLNAGASSLTVSPQTAGLAAGKQTGSITITATGAQNSPLTVPVTVQIVNAGTVKVSSNISAASFNISGAASLSGSGASWSNDDVAPGDYTINFKYVPGYIKPQTRTFTVKTGQETIINGAYRKKPVPTHVIAGSGDSGAVAVMTLDGKPAFTFTPFTDHANVRVAAGDLDGSGTDKIVVSNYKHTIKVYSAQGSPLASYDLPEGSAHADVAVADIDNDGKAEILVGFQTESQDTEQRKITVLSYAAGTVQEKATLFTENKEGKFSFALGDVNDDGILELLLADASSVRAFAISQTAGLTQLWAKSGAFGAEESAPQIAAGDINNDGTAEIAVSYESSKKTKDRGREKERTSVVSILKGTGEDTGIVIEPFKDLGYENPSTVVMGDVNGDGSDELVFGAGRDEDNEPLVRIYAGDGTYAGVTMKPMNGKFGVNVGLGKLQ